MTERTYTAADVAELKAQCAAILEKTVAYIRNLRKTPGGLDLYHTEIQILGRIADGLGKVVIPTDYAAALAEHDEQLRQKFSKECARFHEEGHKCVTCGREDIEELKAQCPTVLEKAAESWRKKAIESREESSRIRRTVSVATEAEANCLIRAEVWDSCADKVTALIPTDHAAALEEVKRQARAAAQDEIRIHIGLFMPINDDEEHYQRGVLSIIDALRAEGDKQP